jgi:hypothetical protein
MLRLVLRGVRWLPRGSYYQAVCEGMAMMALSLHVLFDLFCRNFDRYAAQFTHPRLRYDLADGAVRCPPPP